MKVIAWAGAGAVVAVAAAVLAWQLWPVDEDQSLRDELADIAGVSSVSQKFSPRVRLDPDADRTQVRSALEDVVSVTTQHDLSLSVHFGKVYFRLDESTDPARVADLARSAAGADDLVEAQVVADGDELIEVRLPTGTPLTDATQRVLDRFASEGVDLPAGELSISIPAESPERVEVSVNDLALKEAVAAWDEVRAVLQTPGTSLLSADLRNRRTDLVLQVPALSDVAAARQHVLDKIGTQDVRLTIDSGGVQISQVAERSPSAAVALARQVQQTGASVTDIDTALDGVSIQAADAASAGRVLALMGSDSWPLKPESTVRLSVDMQDGLENSMIAGETASMVRDGPLFLKVLRAGYRAKLQTPGFRSPASTFSIAPARDADNNLLADLTSTSDRKKLVAILRTGTWPDTMQFGIFGAQLVFTSFASTTDGPATDVRTSPNPPADAADLVDGLADVVARWNATADR